MIVESHTPRRNAQVVHPVRRWRIQVGKNPIELGTSTLLRIKFQTPSAGSKKWTTMTLFLICFPNLTMTLHAMHNQHHRHKQLRGMMRRSARG
ncbi:hypothetical protein DPMN_104052 [Dreissena polymorpha]|uniref:Uncharacterized protein n=1 Tax=Dreissena polymorpha TaxID=45954 RepID=A0A9D4H712_DREPO|nr:hypothetical protein DPMN_104052 [Dreissena polymorpha]